MKKIKIAFIPIAFGLILFFGLIFRFPVFDISGNKKQELKFENFQVSVTGMESALSAANDPSAWDGVRAIATFTKAVVDSMDQVIVAIDSTGVLNQTLVYQNNDGIHKLRLDPNANVTVTSTAFGAKTYKNRFDVWDQSDTKVLELFFDDPSTKSEVLVIWRPKHFDPVNISGNDAILECAMTGGAGDGTMICSWNGGPFELNGPFDNARIKVTADSVNAVVNTVALARLQTGTTAYCPLASPTHTARDYYSLAFIANINPPNQTTASGGISEDASATVCGFAILAPNYGRFNTSVFAGASDSKQYYVGDGYATDATGYPLIADVAALHTAMGNGTETHVTVAKVDAINVQFDNSIPAPAI